MLPYFDDFLLHLKTNNYSLETVYNYERDLSVFSQFLEDSSAPFEKTDKRVVAQFKAYLASKDRKTAIKDEKSQAVLSSRSLNRMLSALRSFLKYLIEMDLPCPVPPEAVKMVKTEKRHAQVAEFEDLIKLIESPSFLENDPLVALRNQTIMEVFFSTGMRISELCCLNRSDIDASGKIFVLGKGKKERFVYLTPRAQNILDRYLATRQDAFEALFIPYAGLNVSKPKKRLSTNYIQAKIKEYRQKLKINVPTSAHSLRHGFATYLAESGASPVAIQILLGHESLETTTRYVHASDRFAEETHRKFHPLSKTKK
ncbi:tyrosine-type recombinase/integrase [Patescibacteria group bacterium]|nr:tyrosine-type recombinase/integrase [Patescibacteria group bacterium]